MLTKGDKNDIKDIVVDVIQEVVMPAFETVATKKDLRKVEQRLDNRLDVVDRKLDRWLQTNSMINISSKITKNVLKK